MRLSIRHVTSYSFDQPVRRIIQSHRLTPANSAAQKVLTWNVEIDGATVGAVFRDGAGDWTQTVTLHGPLQGFDIVVSGEVETENTSGVLRQHRESVPPSSYLTRTRSTEPDVAIRDLASDAVEGIEPSEILSRAHALSNAVADAIAYTPGSTQSHTSAAEALAGGAGVCQDHTQVLIAAARTVGIPARYVAGYLHSDASGEAHQASHAWAELFVAGLGWVGFDAANRVCPDEKYIRLGSGADALDAAPIRGMMQGRASERLSVDVSVAEAGSAAHEAQRQQ